MFIPGIEKLKRSQYADVRAVGADPDLQRQPELAWYMKHYPEWRALFDGTALEETVSETTDPTASKPLRWPVQVNLVNSYCILHAGLLWGRGRTGAESDDIFTVRVGDKVPGMPGQPATEASAKLQDILQYFWSHQAHILRHNGAIQQWAGGCVLKVAWNPWSLSSVYGLTLETIQPEYFFPIWDPTNFTDLYAVKVKFGVSKEVAIAKYGVSADDLSNFNNDDAIPVEEYWDRFAYHIILGKRHPEDRGIVARHPATGEPMQGPNPWKHPTRGGGIIPIVYIPRIRTGHFLGDSLAYHLKGVQNELNKTLADYGDALTRGAHPAFGISDFNNPAAKRDKVIEIPRHGALNLGDTRPGGTSPKVHNFPLPQVPTQTTEYVERLLAISESKASLTPAARGLSQGQKSAVTIAMELLPTTNLLDWERAHWSNGIAGSGGLDEIAAVIWWNKKGLYPLVPGIDVAMFGLPQVVDFRPVVPRDRLDVIDEVVRLATVSAVPPREWLKRLGDLEDIDETFEDLVAWLTFMAEKEAAVAGRAIEVSTPTNPRTPKEAYPSIKGKESPVTQQAQQPEGQKHGRAQ